MEDAFLAKHADPHRLAKLSSRVAVVHGHCHHKALFGLDDEKQLLQTLGLDVEVLETGCCGMAGSFGFERGEKYQLSQQIGELDVLPKVRGADPDALLVSDGFSCREQIRAGAQRRPMHIAEVTRLAVLDAKRIPARSVARLDARRPLGFAALALAGLGIGAWLRSASDYSSVIESDVPIVVQHTRLDSRQAAEALLSTVAYSQ